MVETFKRGGKDCVITIKVTSTLNPVRSKPIIEKLSEIEGFFSFTDN